MKNGYRWTARFGLALGAVGVALLLRLALTRLVGPGLPTFITFYPVVMLVALAAGFWPGIICTLLAALISDFGIIPPLGQLDVPNRMESVGLFFFAAMGILMSAVAARYRHTRDHLKELVAERTKDLRESEELMKRTQMLAHLGSWELDIVNNTLSWSDETYRIFGLTPQEFGATYEAFLDAVHPDDRGAVDAAYSGSLREGKDSYEIEHRIVKKPAGELRYVHEKCEHFRDKAGSIVRSVGMVHDITERKHMEEELKRRAEELEAFSYSVSHDLNAPLRAMKNFSEILLAEYSVKLAKEGQDILRMIITSVDRMQTLINDLLSLSRVSRQEIARREIDICSMVRSIVGELRNAQPERNVEISIKDSVKAFADERLMHVALTNLLANAWKYTGKTERPIIEFGVLQKDREVVFYVKDNGVGFDMAFADKLFAPFQRLHPDSEFSGTGIGLATVARIISRHKGRIWAESEKGKGATFYFTLG
jgi:PAS domain S-box-containing protein